MNRKTLLILQGRRRVFRGGVRNRKRPLAHSRSPSTSTSARHTMATMANEGNGFVARFPKAAYWLQRTPMLNLLLYVLTTPSDIDNYMEQANMGSLVSTIMLTALFALPVCIGNEEWTQFHGRYRPPTCDELNLWGVDNVTSGSGVKIGLGASFSARQTDLSLDSALHHACQDPHIVCHIPACVSAALALDAQGAAISPRAQLALSIATVLTRTDGEPCLLAWLWLAVPVGWSVQPDAGSARRTSAFAATLAATSSPRTSWFTTATAISGAGCLRAPQLNICTQTCSESSSTQNSGLGWPCLFSPRRPSYSSYCPPPQSPSSRVTTISTAAVRPRFWRRRAPESCSLLF